MSKGVNKVILIGNLGANPELRYMPNGNPVANIRIATSESWKDKQTGQTQERTEWHSVTLYNKLGEIAGKYLKKGSKVFIEGSLRTTKWQDQNGLDRYKTEIIANNMQMLDSRGAGAAPAESAHHPEATTRESRSTANMESLEDEAFDDDIPF